MQPAGVVAWKSVELNEVENISNSSCVRGKILEGSGFIIRSSPISASMSEVVQILRIDWGKLSKVEKLSSRKRPYARISSVVTGIYALVCRSSLR